MTRDDIIRMAREVKIECDLIDEDEGQVWYITTETLERFAVLVAAAEREACAKVAEASYEKQIFWYPKGYSIDPNSLGEINKYAAARCADAIRKQQETTP